MSQRLSHLNFISSQTLHKYNIVTVCMYIISKKDRIINRMLPSHYSLIA